MLLCSCEEREPSIREVVRECNGDVVQFLHKVLLIGARAGLHANVRDVRNGHCRVEVSELSFVKAKVVIVIALGCVVGAFSEFWFNCGSIFSHI